MISAPKETAVTTTILHINIVKRRPRFASVLDQLIYEIITGTQVVVPQIPPPLSSTPTTTLAANALVSLSGSCHTSPNVLAKVLHKNALQACIHKTAIPRARTPQPIGSVNKMVLTAN